MRTKLSFEDWLREVDREVNRRLGLSRDDLPDVDYSSWYAAGLSAKSAAIRAIKSAKGDEL